MIIDALKRIVAFRTVGDDTETKSTCLDWIWKTFLEKSELTPERGVIHGAPYIYLRHPHPKLLWFGHTDVVPADDQQFTVTVEGDRAYGRGVKDMKGADLTFLIAYREACERGNVPPVSVLLTSDEEVGGKTPVELMEKGMFNNVPVAFTPDTGDADHIVTDLKGACWIRLSASGKSGHGAMPWKSRNPVPSLIDGLQMLLKAFPSPSTEDWGITVTPTQLLGSDAENRIPESASCILDVRFPADRCKTAEELITQLSSYVPKGCVLTPVKFAPPMHCDAAHPMVQMIKTIAEEVTGKSVPIGRDHGSSDARVFTAKGIPAFLYGPVGGDLHGAKEWVSVTSLDQHVEINRRLLASF